jgi:hypothetical protein
MTSDKARKSAVRARMTATGEPYCVAARTLDQAALIDPILLKPYDDERDISAEELGWRVLPADATPAQRARTEAIWRPVSADRPCRCSGPCHHGKECGDDDCPGNLVHVDRVPGSMLDPTGWYDLYRCDICEEGSDTTVTLPNLPWGESTGENTTLVYSGARHPNFHPEAADNDQDYQDDGPGYCPDCGEYLDHDCACDRNLGCPECGARGRGRNPYEECVCEV